MPVLIQIFRARNVAAHVLISGGSGKFAVAGFIKLVPFIPGQSRHNLIFRIVRSSAQQHRLAHGQWLTSLLGEDIPLARANRKLRSAVVKDGDAVSSASHRPERRRRSSDFNLSLSVADDCESCGAMSKLNLNAAISQVAHVDFRERAKPYAIGKIELNLSTRRRAGLNGISRN